MDVSAYAPAASLSVSGARYLAFAHAAQREIARLQGLDRVAPEEPKPIVIHIATEFQEYETLPEPERSAWILFLAHYIEKLYPNIINPRSRPDDAAAFTEMAQAQEAARDGDDSDPFPDPEAVPAGSASDGPPRNAAETAEVEASVSEAYMPSAAAMEEAERRMAEADARALAEDRCLQRQIRPVSRNKTNLSASGHPNPDRALRSLLDRLHSGTLPPPQTPRRPDDSPGS